MGSKEAVGVKASIEGREESPRHRIRYERVRRRVVPQQKTGQRWKRFVVWVKPWGRGGGRKGVLKKKEE